MYVSISFQPRSRTYCCNKSFWFSIQNWTAIIRKYLNLQELDRAIVDELIDYIEVGERTVVNGQRHQDIKVFYRFVGQVEWKQYVSKLRICRSKGEFVFHIVGEKSI